MAKVLTSTIQNQISNKSIGITFTFNLNGVDFSSYLLDWSVSNNISFGAASATFVLNNNSGVFGEDESSEIKVGDVVELIENYTNDSTQWKRFYGEVQQRSITKQANNRVITLTCLDYISVLRDLDIDLELEGTKVEITNETMVPNYLSAPNSMFAQLFDFANNSIADNPRPILVIQDKNNLNEDPQYDGFDVYYDVGQVKFGAPINARDNHTVIAKNYWFYTSGIYLEDAIESILTEVDGYNGYLFGESSSTNVINNHLKSTFQDENGAGTLDYLTPNLTNSTITIRHNVVGAISAGQTTLVLDDISGIPASGTATIAGDSFTWSGVVASTKTLTGIPSSGTNALKEHPNSSIFKYEATYAPGKVWYLTYSNIVTSLTNSNFTIPSSATVNYFDARFGRIILDKAISTASIVRCNYNYTFKTLQATAVEINKISFRSRELKNRYEALQKVREYLAPNYIIRTQGDNKIWASYLSQKTTPDYDLELISSIQYLEDEDLYTRVIMYGKNKNPTNVMFDENVDFVTTGQSYKSIATQAELRYEETVNGWHVYKTQITDAGKILLDAITPIVYINGIPVDNSLHQMISLPVTVSATTRTETSVESSKFGGTDVTVRVYYYYKILFPHQSIEPSRPIYLYNPNGVQIMTISPNDGNMDYGRGIYYSPGDQQNSTLEQISTATYWIMYSTRSLSIDYDTVRFKINSSVLPSPSDAIVEATFEYFTVFTPARGVGAIIDGRWDTQVQTEFFAQPPSGYNYAILDLGQVRNIQAIDMIAGFYKPDEYRKFDIDMRLTLQYSLDNINYFEISDNTHSFQMSGGQSKSFEEEDLGIGFRCRYLKLILEYVKKIDFGENGVYPVAFTEVSIYEDIILKSEANLIATTSLSSSVTSASTTVPVVSTDGFTEPSSGGTETAYIDEQSFTYTGLTSTSFTGCVLSSGINELTGARVSQTIETTTTLYDDDGLLPQLGDRVYKDVRISEEVLYTQTQLDSLAKSYLKEFYKKHSKLTVNVLYSPYLQVGQTVSLTDTFNNQSAVNYFIEQINDSSGNFSLTLAKYPA